MHLENVAGAFVHGCDVAQPATGFVRLAGTRNRGVNVTGNAFGDDSDPVKG